MIKLLPLWLCLPTALLGQDLQLACAGNAPEWELTVQQDSASFSFQRQSDMTIPHQTSAEGRDWPRALTLVSRDDTAIVILDLQNCGNDIYSAQILKQRGQTPVLLTGCCRLLP